jgi:hypothetical protein
VPKHAIWIALLVLILISLPYGIAFVANQPDYVFGGFLLNPQDGNTYLAKMYQGWRGDMHFTLPYSADPGQGGYLFLFYLFLGHIARWTGLSLILLFHLARLSGAALMMVALWRFFVVSITVERWRLWAFAFASLGLGLGWLVFAFGVLSSDFWVAEAYPFLSAFTNPHFPLGLAMTLWLLTLPTLYEDKQAVNWSDDWLAGAAALFLAVLSPFGIVITLCVLAGLLIWELIAQVASVRSQSGSGLSFHAALTTAVCRRLTSRLVWISIFGTPVVLYDLWVTRADPQLAAWNAQNLTLTPPAWDVLLALSPALLLALPGVWQVVRRRERSAQVLLVWALISAALIYAPFGLQRRFLMGLYVPLVGLAVYGLEVLTARYSIRFARWTAVIALGLALPTTLLILVVGMLGAKTHDPALYMTQSEAQALEWLKANTPSDALVLAAPETGLLIPARTGRRVIYGHPFETANAEAEKAQLIHFFKGEIADPSDFLEKSQVDFLVYGPRERKLGSLPGQLNMRQMYAVGLPGADEVIIYQVIDGR